MTNPRFVDVEMYHDRPEPGWVTFTSPTGYETGFLRWLASDIKAPICFPDDRSVAVSADADYVYQQLLMNGLTIEIDGAQMITLDPEFLFTFRDQIGGNPADRLQRWFERRPDTADPADVTAMEDWRAREDRRRQGG